MPSYPRPTRAYSPGGTDATVLTTQDGHDPTNVGSAARNERELGEAHGAAEMGRVEIDY